jgi:hypothetical protein
VLIKKCFKKFYLLHATAMMCEWNNGCKVLSTELGTQQMGDKCQQKGLYIYNVHS